MPVITIQQTDDKTPEQKAEVVKRVTEAVADVYGAKPGSVMVFFNEYSNTEWGKDGLLACDRPKK